MTHHWRGRLFSLCRCCCVRLAGLFLNKWWHSLPSSDPSSKPYKVLADELGEDPLYEVSVNSKNAIVVGARNSRCHAADSDLIMAPRCALGWQVVVCCHDRKGRDSVHQLALVAKATDASSLSSPVRAAQSEAYTHAGRREMRDSETVWHSDAPHPLLLSALMVVQQPAQLAMHGCGGTVMMCVRCAVFA